MATKKTQKPFKATPDFVLVIKGRDRNEVKDHIGETFQQALTQEIEVR